MEQEFDDYLKIKKIDPVAFKSNEPETFLTFKTEFDQLHPKSFTLQKLFYINAIRRKYTYKAPLSENKKTPAVKPLIGARPKINSSSTVRPVLKPKIENKSTVAAGKPVVKPKISAPKPVIKPAPKENASHGDSSAMQEKKNENLKKPIMSRPVIKPKIPPKTKE